VNRSTVERCDCGRSFIDGSPGETLGERLARKQPSSREQLRQTHDTALRRARGWILGVGIAMFVFDQLSVQLGAGAHDPAEERFIALVVDAAVLAFFVVMFVVARKRPMGACIAALCGFWGLHLLGALANPVSVFSGLIPKILFTVALSRGIKAARSAERLRHELAEVFS
jgi:hypothetical protein